MDRFQVVYSLSSASYTACLLRFVAPCMPCVPPLAGYLLGKAGVPKHAIITALGGTPTPNLAAFIDALKVAAREAERLPGGVRLVCTCSGCSLR